MAEQAELQRRETNTQKLLAYLQEHKSATNEELMRKRICGWRAAARILELRKEGHIIETIKMKQNGLYKYIYHGQTVDDQMRLL